MNALWILIVVLLLLAVAGAPVWPYGGFGAGWYPSGGLGIVAVVIILILLFR
jgi:hypothetical protein